MAEVSLRTLKAARKYHRKHRTNDKNHTLFKFYNAEIKARQLETLVEIEKHTENRRLALTMAQAMGGTKNAAKGLNAFLEMMRIK